MKGRFPGMLTTSVSVLIGRSGTKRHRLHLTVRPDTREAPFNRGELRVLAGQTWCGSQRFGSGWHSVRLDAGGVNCEGCLSQKSIDDAPAVDLLETNYGKLAVRQGVTIND